MSKISEELRQEIESHIDYDEIAHHMVHNGSGNHGYKLEFETESTEGIGIISLEYVMYMTLRDTSRSTFDEPEYEITQFFLSFVEVCIEWYEGEEEKPTDLTRDIEIDKDEIEAIIRDIV